MPAYNHEKYVEQALDSVAAETYPALELLVCDDGSSDSTYRIACDWNARHPDVSGRVLRHTHAGIGRTFNRLLGEARGVFVTALASDDELVPGGIAARVAAATTSGARAVFGDALVIAADGTETAPSALRLYGADVQRLQRDPAAELISRWRVPGPVLLAETVALRELGGWSEDVLIEDWDLYLRLAARGWLRYIDVTVGRYRVHQRNVSADPARRSEILADHRRVAKRNAPLFRGGKRAALVLQRVAYQPWLVETEYNRVSHFPARLASKFIRSIAERIAG